MIKEEKLEEIIELCWFLIKIFIVIFICIALITITFLSLAIIGKVYDYETAMGLQKVIRLIYNGNFYFILIFAMVGLIAQLLIFLLKKDKIWREKKKKDFERFVEGIIKKSRRKR
ncbi:unnamed protein product [marine sediment metagenome]|uniref:Uncharacterized protein n=1 Tax=marine sediment metagenome TaxID=412755 RepID=X1C643_9ZZZZ